MLEVYINSQKTDISGMRVLGTGGQGTVYDGGKYAIKIFNDTALPLVQSNVEFAHKQRLYHGLQQVAATPQDLVCDSQLKVIGYTMEKLIGYKPLRELCDATFKKNNALGLKAIVYTFLRLHSSITKIHAGGFRVGDMSERNVFIKFAQPRVLEMRLLDADSWAYPNPHSPANWGVEYIDEEVKHPKIDIAATKDPKLLSGILERHDWYAFSQLLATALLNSNPYDIGRSFRISQSNADMQTRKENLLSAWHYDVSLSKSERIATLRLGARVNFALKHFIHAKAKDPFPITVLSYLYQQLVRCSNCHLEANADTLFCLKCFQPLPRPQ